MGIRLIQSLNLKLSINLISISCTIVNIKKNKHLLNTSYKLNGNNVIKKNLILSLRDSSSGKTLSLILQKLLVNRLIKYRMCKINTIKRKESNLEKIDTIATNVVITKALFFVFYSF